MHLNRIFGCSDKVAIVTGGAGLYGFSISEALCQAGATVIVASRTDQAFKRKFSKRKPKYRVFHRFLDLGQEDSINSLFRDVNTEFGRVDILVNNALTDLGNSLENTPTSQWHNSLSGNVLSLFLMCRSAAATMRSRGSGSIINISSIWGLVAPDFRTYLETKSVPNPIDYGFIKGGMLMFTRSLASYLGRDGVRVNSIVPGGIHDDTDNKEYIAAYTRKVPLGRWAMPDDIKGAVIFLASEASAYVTGANIVVDGGYTAM